MFLPILFVFCNNIATLAFSLRNFFTAIAPSRVGFIVDGHTPANFELIKHYIFNIARFFNIRKSTFTIVQFGKTPVRIITQDKRVGNIMEYHKRLKLKVYPKSSHYFPRACLIFMCLEGAYPREAYPREAYPREAYTQECLLNVLKHAT